MSSVYYNNLEFLAQMRYREKLLVKLPDRQPIDLPDPLDVLLRQTVFVDDTRNWPELTFGYIYMYLVQTHCWYTQEQFQSYKHLDGYNLFASGKVKQIATYCAPTRVAIVISADVEAGQTLGKLYQSWIVLEQSGRILSGHCTCMAGLGEACSHIAALLFAVETTAQLDKNKPTCTSLPCKWKAVAQRVMPSKVAHIDFRKPMYKKRDKVYEEATPKKKRLRPINISPDFKRNLVKTIMDETEVSHLHTVFCDSEDTDTADSSDETVPISSPNLLHLTATYLFSNKTAGTALGCSISKEQAFEIENRTREQSQCHLWKEQRKGRITASYFGRVYKVKSGMDNLVSQVMGESEAPEGLPSLQWGKKKESEAIISFQKLESPKHQGFEIARSGLWVSTDRPFMGASPDGLISCACCPDAVLEIKCPYSIRAEKISASCGKKNFYLGEDGKLKKSHNYFFQVQGVMALTERKKCFFVVFTTVDLHVEEIFFDAKLWDFLKQRIESFFLKFVFPKLIAP